MRVRTCLRGGSSEQLRWLVVTRTVETPTDSLALGAGQTLLVAESGDLRHHGVDMELLAARSSPSEGVALVSTTSSAKAILADYEAQDPENAADVLGIVDAVSTDQNLFDSYRETPITHVSGPQDVARLSLALGDLPRSSGRAVRRRHLVVQSLTPLLETSDSEVVCRLIRRATDDSTFIDGFSILTVDFTAHDEQTFEQVRDLADFVLWVEESPDGTLDFEIEQIGPLKIGAND